MTAHATARTNIWSGLELMLATMGLEEDDLYKKEEDKDGVREWLDDWITNLEDGLSRNISIDDLSILSGNISRRDTEEKIYGAEHHLPQKYLLRDRSGRYGKVRREVQR